MLVSRLQSNISHLIPGVLHVIRWMERVWIALIAMHWQKLKMISTQPLRLLLESNLLLL